ncbi:restriction endonuclease subunit S [Arachnia propionica]|uniref:restriction endonuclease subunit S n=1 Tax=Arachnia propionica TaxID=1750 RepID=UPI0028E8EAD5|nr:restriction endonuclease subunit S [Arachnia propionica]
MSRIDQLIADLCPDGVEFKALGDMGSFTRGNGLQKTDLLGEGTPAIHYGQVHTLYGTWTTQTKSFVSPELASKLRRAKQGDLVIATTSEDDDAVAKATAWLGRDEAAVSGDAYIYRHCLDPKYVAYFFQSGSFQEQKKRHITGAKVRRISGEALGKIRIPVPPFEVQREIARVLDKFTQLEAELEAELEARRRQYEYYRDQLLTFSKEATFPRLPLGEVALIVRGASPRPIRKFLTSDKSGIPWIKIGDVAAEDKYITTTTERVTEAGAAKSRRVSPGDFVLSNSMSFGRPFIMKIEGCVHDGWLVISNFDKSFVPDFLYHLLRSQPIQEEFVRRAGSGGAVSNLNSDTVKALTVPIPPLQEQRRIVSILDKFDSLVNDLSIGLPAELAARRKQYEYYRDRLLTFEEKR